MLTPTPAGAAWPVRLAYAAGVLFTVTSAATNAVYGWHKGADLPSALIWLLVSIAASIVFALSVPALLTSLTARKWAQALLVCIGFVVCGSYSIVAALGSASGGRIDAAVSEKAAGDARKKAQAAYDKATADLAALKPARPVPELEALVAAPALCRIVVSNGGRQTVCARPAALTAELGRATRRTELEAKLETARAELRAAPVRQANSDAAALAGYLAALGVVVQADTLNQILVLLAVLVIELGGGASLAVGMALGDTGRHAPETRKRGTVPAGTPSVPERVPDAPPRAFPAFHRCSVQQQHAPHETLDQRLLRLVAERGGTLIAGQREIGRLIGVSSSHAHRLLHDLSGAGIVSLTPGRTGTIVKRIVN